MRQGQGTGSDSRRRPLVDLGWAFFRKLTQLGTLGFIAWAAATSIWRNYAVAHNSGRLVGLMHGETAERAYRANEALLSVGGGDAVERSGEWLGMPWAAVLGGWTVVDPILALSQLATNPSPSPALAAAIASPVILAALLGKVFCSHICPMRFFFEIGQKVRAGILRVGVPLPTLRFKVRLGGWVLLGGLVAAAATSTAVWFFVLPYLGIGGGMFMSITAGTTAGLLALPCGWLLADILFAPGMWCHNLCPTGFVLENIGRVSWLRISHTKKTACPRKCHTCELVCPYGLSPRELSHRPACDACGACIPVCPERKLGRRFHLPVVAALVLLFVPAIASAHHNKGLPHYGYYENYPQAPTEEVIVVDGRWEMGATVFNFQGLDRTESDTPHDVKFFVYLYDLELDQNYEGPAEFDIMLDGELVRTFSRTETDEEMLYTTRETLPETGDYDLVARIPLTETPTEVVIPFHIDLDEEGISWPIVLGVLGPVLPLFILALIGRGKRGRAHQLRAASRAREAHS